MISEEAKKELEKMLMESYDKGVADATEAAMKALEVGINKAVAAEREACARIIEADADARGKGGGGLVLLKAAERIRARGES